MPDFAYIARESSGQQVSGVVSAASEQEALSTLSSRALFPVSVEVSESAQSAKSLASRRISQRQLAIFYTQLADLLRSGVPLLRSLELLERQSSSDRLRSVVQDVKEQVADGTALNESLRRHPKVFGELVVSMLRAGEEGGFLEDVLERVARFTEHQEDLKGRVIGALVYPAVLLSFGTIVVTVILVWLVPQFEEFFDQMAAQGQLPWATTALMGLSDWIARYWVLFLIALAGGCYALFRAAQTPAGRYRIDEWKLKTPLLGNVVRSLAISRFCRILGTLLRNGVPVLQSLRISKDATGNVVLVNAIAEASSNVSAGKNLARPLAASGEFPEQIVEMIAVGEEANNLETVLINIADTLERHTNRNLEMAVRLVEPLLLLVMAGVVLFVVIALLLPILQSNAIL